MAASKKREKEGYDTQGLDSRQEVEQALAGAQYRPSQTVQQAAQQLQQMQGQRPAEYESAYQERMDQLLEKLMGRESFRYHYQQDPLYRQYAQAYTQNAQNASAAQQAYQQQINGLNSAIPTLYSLALDTYTSEGEAMESQLEQLNTLERGAQDRYDQQMEHYYDQLDRMGEAYNAAAQQDYQQYLGYLDRLDTLHGYYSQQEQAQAARRQQGFQNLLSVLGVVGDMVQLAISGTTGLGSLAGGLLNTGYGIYADNRQYEADRADAAWSQQMQQMQYQSSLEQQRYENADAERRYQDTLAQRKAANARADEKLALARSKWAAQQAKAQQSADRETGAFQGDTPALADKGGVKKEWNARYAAARLKDLGRTDQQIRAALQREGFTDAQARKILEEMNKRK